MSARTFSADDDPRIAAEYERGAGLVQLAAKYGCSTTSVRSAVRRGGGQIRKGGGQPHRWDAESEAEALRMYRAGASVKALARHFQVRSGVISKLLARTGTELHLGGLVHPLFRTPEQCAELVERYNSGIPLSKLAKQYGCGVPTIQKAIKRIGASPRPPGPPQQWTRELEKWAVAAYKSGMSQQEIAEAVGVSQGSVSNKLRQMGEWITPAWAKRGEEHPAWKGGRTVRDGYVWVVVTDDDLDYCRPNSSGYVAEHRLVMGRALGRPLTQHETVHHINGDRMDNRLENLQLRQGKHGAGVVMRCASCGSHDVEAAPIKD